jgi:hypothetical protein
MDKYVTQVYGDALVYRAIGYDCSPADNKRFAHAKTKTGQSRASDRFIYPLQVWGWHRIECARQIELAGLPVPPKSSCFFCPAMKAHEVEALPVDKLRRIVIMEANASINLNVVVGLWRSKRMTDHIRAKGLLPSEEIDALWLKWSAPARLITIKTVASEDVLVEAAA